MKTLVTNLPFKISLKAIVILKEIPILQCEHCGEYVLEDPVMQRVEILLDKMNCSRQPYGMA